MSKRHLKHRLLHILEGDPAAGKPGRFVQSALIALVIANIVSIILESVHHLHTDYLAYFHGFEVFSIVVFTIEYLARFWTASEKHEDQPWLARRKYALSFFGLIDLISILPFYLQFFVPGMDLRILRVVRLLRTFKLSHFNSAIEDLFSALYHARASVYSTIYLFLIALLLTSTAMYHAEHELQPDKFGSIPAAMYWSVISLTTVGYGDVTPVSSLGKFISAITAFLGVSSVAMLTGVVASAFANQVERRKVLLEAELRMAMEDGELTHEESALIRKMKREFNLSDELVHAMTEQVRREHKLQAERDKK
jgi:voltage-gated potassium channel